MPNLLRISDTGVVVLAACLCRDERLGIGGIG